MIRLLYTKSVSRKRMQIYIWSTWILLGLFSGKNLDIYYILSRTMVLYKDCRFLEWVMSIIFIYSLFLNSLKILLKYSWFTTYYFYFKKFILYWSIVDLQCCVSFRYIEKWVNYIYTVSILFKLFSHLGYYRIISS